jgi:hypothetical protein
MNRLDITAQAPSVTHHRPDECLIDANLREKLRSDLAVPIGIEGIIDVMKESDQRPIGLIVSIMPGKGFHHRFHAIGVVEMSFVGGVFLQ